MRVIGVDPGLTRCGVAVVSGAPGRPLVAEHIGVVTTPSTTPTPERLMQIEAALVDLIARHQPDALAVERVFSQQNVRSAMATAQAAGVAMLVAARLGMPVAMHTPTEVKAAVTGSGRADKAQVTAMVTRLLRLDAPPKPADAADALAIAITHVWRGSAQAKLTAAQAKVEAALATARASAKAGSRLGAAS